MKFLFSHNDQKTEFKADYGQIMNYLKNNSKEEIAESFSQNKYQLINIAFDEDVSFKGGTYQDLFKDVVIDTKQQLDAKPAQNFVNKRKRFLSEHDGDYVHERRYDINFMESARREKVAGNNLIKIKAVSGYQSDISFKQIDQYAREICELVNYFESQGRTVELDLHYNKKNLWLDSEKILIDIKVKRPDQYLSKADIYRAFSALFHRSIGFASFCACAEIAESDVSSGMGFSVVHNNRVTVTDSEIIIHGLTKDLVNLVKKQSA